MEHSTLFLENLKKNRFQVWNFAKFQTWNRIFLGFCKKSGECSKINEIYLLWTSSEPILSKIRAPFFSKKKASVVVWIWKKNPKISEFFNFKSDFFLILQKKSRMFQNKWNLFTLNLIWQNFEQNQRTFFDRYITTLARGCLGKGRRS